MASSLEQREDRKEELIKKNRFLFSLKVRLFMSAPHPPSGPFPIQGQPILKPPTSSQPSQVAFTFDPRFQTQPKSTIISQPTPQPAVIFRPVASSQPPQVKFSFSPQFQLKPATVPPATIPQQVPPVAIPQQVPPVAIPQQFRPVAIPQQFRTIDSPPGQQFQTAAGSSSQQFRAASTTSPQFQTIASPSGQQFQPITSSQILTKPSTPALTGAPVGQIVDFPRREVSKSTISVKKPQKLAPLSEVPGPILSGVSPRARTDKIWETFRRDDLFLLENDTRTPYRRRNDENKTSVHWGQRKLALTTLAVINFYWNPKQVPNPVVIYAGAAPGRNLNFVMRLNPEIEWHLYDPHPVGFKIKPEYKSRVHTYKELFTDQIAHTWAGRKDIFFISDIRTVDITVTKVKEEIEAGIWGDMEMQEKWVKIIKPVVALLKFRLPYSDIKFAENIDYRKGLAPYLAGIVLKQPWAAQTSTETRLLVPSSSIVNGKYLTHNWDIKAYEDRMFHLNAVVRELVYFYNPFYLNNLTKREEPIIPPELTNDWDSMSEMTILNDYLIKRGTVEDHLGGIRGLSNLLTLSLQPKTQKRFGAKDKTLTLDFLRHHPRHFKGHFRPKDI